MHLHLVVLDTETIETTMRDCAKRRATRCAGSSSTVTTTARGCCARSAAKSACVRKGASRGTRNFCRRYLLREV